MLGDRLLADSVNLSPVLTAGWAGLIVNALNCLPVGGSPWQPVLSCTSANRYSTASSRQLAQVPPLSGQMDAEDCMAVEQQQHCSCPGD